MGIYLRNMEMPKTCWYCEFNKHHVCICNRKHIDNVNAKLPTCPLIEINLLPYQLEFLQKVLEIVGAERSET